MGGYFEFMLAAAFLAGLTGGVHCAAMCGPLVGIACRAQSRGDDAPVLRRSLAYSAGRIASYAVAGGMTGALGAAGLALRGGAAVQQALLTVMSLSLILLAGYIAGLAPLRRVLEPAGALIWRRIEPQARRFLPATTAVRAFGLGLVWGWLPCGMVYVALISAAATGDPVHGALLMAAFGLGTLPNLLALSAWFAWLPRFLQGRRRTRIVAAAVVAAAGMLGLAHAARPALASAHAWWCLEAPGIVSLTGKDG